jgi:predicted DsbA family dithiol-disulfide isomerase
MISATLYSDPACPWAYSENPALRVLDWRYGDQLDWRLVVIGLSEDTSRYAKFGYTPLRGALGQLNYRRFGMPFAPAPKERPAASARACRAIVAARLANPGREWLVFRALQLANFTTPLLLDDEDQLTEVLRGLSGVDADAVIASLDDPAVSEAYQRDRAEARTAAGSPSEFQRKTATSDGPVRYTAPSVVFEYEGTRLEAGGFQTIEAYDVLVANLDPTLHREAAPDSAAPVIERFPGGVTTQEVAAIMTRGNDAVDRVAAEKALLEAVAAGEAERVPLGDDALWLAPGAPRSAAFGARHAVAGV